MVTTDALMKKSDALEKQIQEQNKQTEGLISLLNAKHIHWQNIKPTIEKINRVHPDFHLSKCLNQPEPCEETKNKLFGSEDSSTKHLVQNMGVLINPRPIKLFRKQP